MAVAQKRREAVTISVRVDKDVATALNVFAALENRYVYDVLEEFIKRGLEAHKTSVPILLGANSARELQHAQTQ